MNSTAADDAPIPDTKDWTWVLQEPCSDCGFDARAADRDRIAALTGAVTSLWCETFAAVEVPARRPAPRVWSPLEYACHVRDVVELASYRVTLMLDEDDPAYPNWDQDATAIEKDYAGEDPQAVLAQLSAAGDGFAAVIAAVPSDAWQRTGRRGDGADFTVESFVRYLLHDAVHHLTDITGERWP